MRHARSEISLHWQLLALLAACASLLATAAVCLAGGATPLLGVCFLLLALAAFALGARKVAQAAAAFRAVRERIEGVVAGDLASGLRPDGHVRELADLAGSVSRMVDGLRRSRLEHEQSQNELSQRTHALDRLLEFSQTIQGAGRVQQIFPTLCHFLTSELKLAGVVALSQDADASPAIQMRACCPDAFVRNPVVDFEPALCPCLRQSQPRLFRAEGSPVRCTVEQYLDCPTNRQAYCVPFNVGPKSRVVLHMVLPDGQTWTESMRQLAQTYCNTAQSAMTSLNLLEEAEKQSMTDSLTGLFNRRSLEQLLMREVALAERHRQPLSVVMIDMDYFKQINDAHGHAAGDHLLRAFADCVRITLRKTDLAFRYGGDEFVIALPQTPIIQAQQVVQKLRQAFASVDFSSAIAHLEQQPTLSIGVAERSAAQNLLTLPALLGAADQALYEAKASSRNCVKTYSPPQAA